MTNILPTYIKHRIPSDQGTLLQPEVAGQNLVTLFGTILEEINLRFNDPVNLLVSQDGFYQEIRTVDDRPIQLVGIDFLQSIAYQNIELVSSPEFLNTV